MTSTLAALAALAALATPAPHVERDLGPIVCHPVRCTQTVTVTRPFLSGTLVTVRAHSRPTNTRNGLPAPWTRWRIVYGYVGGPR